MCSSSSSSSGISFAEEGDVNIALKTCIKTRIKHELESLGNQRTLIRRLLFKYPNSS